MLLIIDESIKIIPPSNELLLLSEITEKQEISGTKRGNIKTWDKESMTGKRQTNSGKQEGIISCLLLSNAVSVTVWKTDWQQMREDENGKKRTEGGGQRKRETRTTTITSNNRLEHLTISVKVSHASHAPSLSEPEWLMCLSLFLIIKQRQRALCWSMGHSDSETLAWLKEQQNKVLHFAQDIPTAAVLAGFLIQFSVDIHFPYWMNPNAAHKNVRN